MFSASYRERCQAWIGQEQLYRFMIRVVVQCNRRIYSSPYWEPVPIPARRSFDLTRWTMSALPPRHSGSVITSLLTLVRGGGLVSNWVWLKEPPNSAGLLRLAFWAATTNRSSWERRMWISTGAFAGCVREPEAMSSY